MPRRGRKKGGEMEIKDTNNKALNNHQSFDGRA
jgi:hypothetical protein